MKREFLFTIFFILFILIAGVSYSQTSISGIINSYSAVDSVYPTKDTVKVVNSAAFSPDDTVMVYQAKGAQARTSGFPHLFGDVEASGINNAGNYEIILVQEVTGPLVIFKSVLIQDYDEEGFVQLIKVPSYKNASIDGELTCKAWEDSVGGILALMVSDTLYLNSNINVTGKGFRGAAPYNSNGTCSSADSAKYGLPYFSLSDTVSAGFKGEGIAVRDTSYIKGLGRWSNAGGGGNAKFSGGGGGANGGKGGYGGEEDTLTCPSTPNYEDNPDYFGFWNALGGSDGFGLGTSFIDTSRIFMGGGGGSGTFTDGLVATNGANGGGIVIILAKVVKANGAGIQVNGGSVSGVADASGGGGGGGGTTVFDVDSVIGDLSISIKGGNGGRVQTYGASGPGGGGGGGALLFHGVSPYDNDYNRDLSGGIAGFSNPLQPNTTRHKAKSGETGTTKPGKAQLTGFLYNNITPNQRICMGDVPEKIYGSEPRGGNGTYFFDWQYQAESTGWAWTSTGETTKHYQPPALTDTTYYRRVVTSGTVIDYGNVVEIKVQDYIVGNNIFGDDLTTCIGDQADTITGTTVLLGGNNISYQYIWESRIDDDNVWNTITEIDSVTCLPGTIFDTTYVRRVVISGACYDTTANIEIIGLPKITNNILSADQEICEGQKPEVIIGQVPENGDGTYTYSWESRTESSNWNIITDSTRKDFAPINLFETMYYRRIVRSDDCIDISDSVQINVLPPIQNDNIVTTYPIYTCYGTQPELLDGSTPTGGDGTYNYQWQISANGLVWNNIDAATNEDYQPEALTDTTFFRRIVTSGLDGCCSSITDTLEVNIYILPVAAIEDRIDTICSGEEITLNISVEQGLQPYIITYNNGYADQTSGTVNSTSYNPIVTPQTTNESMEYSYTVISVIDANNCLATDITGQTDITVYGNPTADAGVADTVCQLAYPLSATKSYTNTTGIWSQLIGLGQTDFNSQQANANVNISVDTADTYKYQWVETNWHRCRDTAEVEVTMYKNLRNIKIVQPDTVSKQGVDTIIYDGMSLKVIGEYDNRNFGHVIKEVWTTDNPSIMISPDEKSATFSWTESDVVENFRVEWYVDKGACPDTTFAVNVRVEDYVFVPNGFTPNGDGVNDNFVITGLDDQDINHLIIYNRWGTEVYESSDYSNNDGWDGYHDNKALPEGTYFYILTREKPNGIVDKRNGFIVLKRY